MSSGITEFQVYGAYQEILANKEEPTIEKIRNILGTGSNSTIVKYLRKFRGDPKYIENSLSVTLSKMYFSKDYENLNSVLNKLKNKIKKLDKNLDYSKELLLVCRSVINGLD